MAGQNINDAFAAILQDCQAIAVEAVKNAAKKTQNDIVKEANSYLQKYYSNYKPTMYKRTYRLKRAIFPVWIDRSNANGISIEVGVQYKSSALVGTYRSNSWYHQNGDEWISRGRGDFNFNSPNNGIPEPDWILENFLEGLHKWGDKPGQYKQDSESTNSLMEDFFNTQLPNRIEQYVQEELLNSIINKL